MVFAPQLMGLGQVFDKGKEPFQSFKAVIQRRNGVVHTKGEGRVVILSDKAAPDDYMAENSFKPRALFALLAPWLRS